MTGVLLFSLALAVVHPAAVDDPLERALGEIEAALNNNIAAWEARVETGVTEGEEGSLAWQPVRLTHYSRENRIRYRADVTIPAVSAGTAISGGRAVLQLSMRGPADYRAEVFVDGNKVLDGPAVDPRTRIQSIPPIVLSESASPGQKFHVEVVVHNRLIYPPHEFLDSSRNVSFRGGQLELEQDAGLREKLEAFRINLRSGQAFSRKWRPNENDKRPFWPVRISHSRLKDEDRNRIGEALQSAAAEFDLEALAEGNAQAVEASIDAVMNRLGDVSQYIKQFTVYLVGNAHIDLAWLWRTRESVQIAANTFRAALNNIGEFKDMVYAQSQAQAYSWVEEKDPELFKAIMNAAEGGNWDVVGGMWAEPDCNLIGGESWVRQLLYAQRYFREHFGRIARLGWNPDSFGYNWNMPQFYSKAGIRAFITQKIGWNMQTHFPYHLFWWESPDGSRILAYMPTGGYTESVRPERMVEQLLNFEDATGFKDMLSLIGIGDHGGGPNRPMLERAEMLKEQPLFPNVAYIRPHQYIEMLLERDLSELPVWKSEMYLENHRGTYTTQADTKRNNRKNEGLLETAEKAASIAGLYGMTWPAEELERAWKLVLLNQFHDILPGSSITPVYRDAAESHATVRKLAQIVIDRSLEEIFTRADLPSDVGIKLLVFNQLSWERDAVVRVPLKPSDPAAITVLDPEGRERPSFITTAANGIDRELLFRATSLPPMGYKIYSLQPSNKEVKSEAGKGTVIENEFLRVSVDPQTGNISSIYDKVNEREVLESGKEGNIIELHENLPSYWDAWNIGYTDNHWTLNEADSVELLEEGPLRSVIHVKKSFLGLSKANRAPTEGFPSSFFTQDIILYKGVPRLDVEMSIDWWEDHTLLKVAFPFAVKAKTATYEIAYGSIERPTARDEEWQKARYEVPVHRWADLSADGYGVSLLNDRKYGMDTYGNVMRLSLLTSALWPDPMADRGTHKVLYSIYPHKGDWRSAGTVRQAQDLNLQPACLLVRRGKGFEEFAGSSSRKIVRVDNILDEDSRSATFFSIDADNAFVSTIKRAENGEGLIIRVVESEGKAGRVTVTLPFSPTAAHEVDLLENKIDGAIDINGNTVSFDLGANEVKSLEVMPAKGR